MPQKSSPSEGKVRPYQHYGSVINCCQAWLVGLSERHYSKAQKNQHNIGHYCFEMLVLHYKVYGTTLLPLVQL